jgi:RNA polymerase sigma factor (sigma-70 family)
VEEIEALVIRARQGDTNAFGEIVRRLQDMVVGYAYARLGDFGLAEDAAQDAFVQAFLELPSLRQPRAFAAWLRRITFTHCHAIRRRRRSATIAIDLVEPASREKGPVEQAQDRELREAVLKAIQALPPAERAATTLFHINGYSLEQVSGFLDVPIGTVKSRLGRARSRLEERMMHMVDKTLKDNAPDEQFSKAVLLKLPKVYDDGPTSHLPDTLDEFQAKLLLSAVPKGTEIAELKTVFPIYRYPLRVHCRDSAGRETEIELHTGTNTPCEAQLLPVLAEMGLPVAKVLAGPAAHPDYPEVGPMVVLGSPPGKDLPFVRASSEDIDLTCRLMLEGIGRLRQLTDALQKHPIGKLLPRRPLSSLLDAIVKRGGPWLENKTFSKAVATLRHALPPAVVPLVFSNGLNISFNFRYDGQQLTEYCKFGRACFEDPHIHFAKYKVWEIDTFGWGPFARAGFVERYLYEQNVSKAQFAPRLALWCLDRLQAAMPVASDERPDRRPEEEESWARERQSCLTLLEESLRLIR